jgi:hypothetical protein
MDVINKFQSFYSDLASMKVEDLSSIYSENVTFIDPVTTHSGITSVESYFSNLLQDTKYCIFTINAIESTSSIEDQDANKVDKLSYMVTWVMTFSSPRLNSGAPINVDGITQLIVENNKISYHRDYYDLGQMVYENVPLLGWIIKRIKRRLA